MEPPVVIERTDWNEVVHRARTWQPSNLQELKDLGIIIRSAYNGNDEEAVRILCQIMLQHDDVLPALYKAKFHAYLADCQGQH